MKPLIVASVLMLCGCAQMQAARECNAANPMPARYYFATGLGLIGGMINASDPEIQRINMARDACRAQIQASAQD